MKSAIPTLILLLSAIFQDAEGEPAYREPFRPQFHFTPEKNWMNDPNGMVFYEGEYHLFYQHNPFGNKWGHMSWGHAVSEDLIRWKHLPLAIPEADKVMIFSGSAVVDWKNSSGFGKGGKPPLVAIYTGHHTNKKRQDQRIAFSNDRGRTWTKYAENPVLDLRVADFRDPKVIWHEGSETWVMVVSHPVDRQVGFYGSPDLKHWRPLTEFGPAGSTTGIWECPDLFPLTIDGDKARQKWVLVVNVGGGAPAGGSGCQYFVGEFDGRKFTADPKTHPDLRSEGGGPPAGELIADFESGYGDWVATGDAFGSRPAIGALEGQMKVEGFLGKAFVNSFNHRDKGKGTLTSPTFEITADHLNFLIGGGAHKGRTCMNLRVGGKVVRTATGDEAERLTWKSWDVRELRAKTATLQIVDNETSGWGHVNVDHIMLSPTAAKVAKATALWADYGRDFYAAVSWSDIPEHDGRRLWIGWMSNWQYAQAVPTSPWRSAMTVPRELGLTETERGYRLNQKPVRELERLREFNTIIDDDSVEGSKTWLAKFPGEQLLDGTFSFSDVRSDSAFGIMIRSRGGDEVTSLRYADGSLTLDRTRSGRTDFHPAFAGKHVAPCEPSKGKLSIRLLLDTSSVEVFAAGGRTVLSDLIFPKAGGYVLEVFSEEGRPVPNLPASRLSTLRSAWR